MNRGWHEGQARKLTALFVKAGAITPERAVTLAHLGVELAHADRDGAREFGYIYEAAPGRFYATDRGRAAAAGETLPRRPHVAVRMRRALGIGCA